MIFRGFALCIPTTGPSGLRVIPIAIVMEAFVIRMATVRRHVPIRVNAQRATIAVAGNVFVSRRARRVHPAVTCRARRLLLALVLVIFSFAPMCVVQLPIALWAFIVHLPKVVLAFAFRRPIVAMKAVRVPVRIVVRMEHAL